MQRHEKKKKVRPLKNKKVYIVMYSGRTLNDIFGVFSNQLNAVDYVRFICDTSCGSSRNEWSIIEKEVIDYAPKTSKNSPHPQ